MIFSKRLNFVALACAAWLVAMPSVQANPSLSAISSANAGVGSASPVSGGDADFVYSRSVISNSEGTGQSSGFARSNGSYAVSSQATGVSNSSAHAGFSYDLLNDSGAAQTYSLHFKIYGGYIGSFLSDGETFGDGEFSRSDYLATIGLNGDKVFSSSATIRGDKSGFSMTHEGVRLNANNDGSDGEYFWDYVYVNMERTLAAGESLSIVANMDISSFSQVGAAVNGCAAPPTAQTALSSLAGDCFKAEGRGFYGDPFIADGEGSPGFFFTAAPANQVPEPASLALVLLSLGLSWGMAKGRRA
ncbi:PEP-CTERM sorting domain-containing protein [Paucibacter sp. Y2R2-4]|uniref:PEP-CTERM sorting domain-containing protein n=1 Tax=Paucibacter sp. Y2R2-4 TaxID=2893553 RepID=UPI0021E4C37B|nr:PEP-CTERM sorting domain-containing protein [Paucibacter sp. Y2R2-4]MCV2349459.1 PEP-CTERM sorting domain-containing protein [Paucibacter sp. Y2R2-4]